MQDPELDVRMLHDARQVFVRPAPPIAPQPVLADSVVEEAVETDARPDRSLDPQVGRLDHFRAGVRRASPHLERRDIHRQHTEARLVDAQGSKLSTMPS